VERIPLQPTSVEITNKKYQLKDAQSNPIDKSLDDIYMRVATALASVEENPSDYIKLFYYALNSGATPAGRILSNAGAGKYKPATSLINCTLSETVKDSMEGILGSNLKAGLTLKAGCGIGYEFSTLRPSGSFVAGAGASTSGPLSFMDIFDSTCFTVSSAGGRRGAQMGTFAVWHPDVYKFIQAKRENGKLRNFNLSLLIDDEFMYAVNNEQPWDLIFPVLHKEIELNLLTSDTRTVWKKLFWELDYCEEMKYTLNESKTHILCRVYETVAATDLWETIMRSTYDFAEPGFLLIDKINEYNNNYFCEVIRATNPCGEQPLPPNGACLLGSINLAFLVKNPFTPEASFDWLEYRKLIKIFSRMLDNVVELSALPLPEQEEELKYKRRHGMGFTGLGSALSMLGMRYGGHQSIHFAEEVQKVMAIEGYAAGIDLAKEKGAAPILQDTTNRKLWAESKFLKQIWEERPDLLMEALEYGCRYTHATSIAPTGTISLSVNNNVSNGIEPSFSHKYTRNVIQEGKNSKEAVTVYSYEMLLYKHLFCNDEVPENFSTSDTVTVREHIDIQAAVQKWCDSSISKTINVPTATKFEDFGDIYLYAYACGLKGCTTFRFNPETLQGVLVRDEDLQNTDYIFYLEGGEEIVVNGADSITYNGETSKANNLYDAIKEGYYGKL